jgi:ABC-type molybdate transport system permease subunit
MDWTALWLSLRLAGWTVVILLPVAILVLCVAVLEHGFPPGYGRPTNRRTLR